MSYNLLAKITSKQIDFLVNFFGIMIEKTISALLLKFLFALMCVTREVCAD